MLWCNVNCNYLLHFVIMIFKKSYTYMLIILGFLWHEAFTDILHLVDLLFFTLAPPVRSIRSPSVRRWGWGEWWLSWNQCLWGGRQQPGKWITAQHGLELAWLHMLENTPKRSSAHSPRGWQPLTPSLTWEQRSIRNLRLTKPQIYIWFGTTFSETSNIKRSALG